MDGTVGLILMKIAQPSCVFHVCLCMSVHVSKYSLHANGCSSGGSRKQSGEEFSSCE